MNEFVRFFFLDLKAKINAFKNFNLQMYQNNYNNLSKANPYDNIQPI